MLKICCYFTMLKSPLLTKMLRSSVNTLLSGGKLFHNSSSPLNCPEKLSGFKKLMVDNMVYSQTVPHLILGEEIVVTQLTQLKKVLNNEKKEVHLTYLPFFIKAASNALKKYPIMNAVADHHFENVTFRDEQHIAICIDTPNGLAVPVIRNVENLTINDIAKEVIRLQNDAMKGESAPKDMGGATFTISNVGAVSGTYAKPAVFPSQLAIIAVGKKMIVPRYDANMNLLPQEVINLSTCADHRVIDGATTGRFNLYIKKQIENPALFFY